MNVFLKFFSLRANLIAFKELVSVIISHQSLCKEMVKREIKDQYAGSILGSLWAIGNPLMMISIYLFLFSVVLQLKFPDAQNVSGDYVVYLLSGVVPWLTVSSALNRAVFSFKGNANLVKQVIFPIEVLPLRSVIASFLPQVIGLVIIISYIIFKGYFSFYTLLLLPLALLIMFIMLLGMAFFLSSICVLLPDIKEIVSLATIVGLYATPIFYIADWVPEVIRPIIYINPFYYTMAAYRDALFYGVLREPGLITIGFGLSLLFLIFGYRTFRSLKPTFGNHL